MYFSRNVIILLILRAVRWFLVVMPVVTIFYREHGLSNQDIFILQAFYAIVVVLSEIPTGYFSDVLGRKKSLILGMIFWVIGLGTYAMTRDFWWFLIAELILWLGSSFISGTDSAMLYDTLLDEGKAVENKKIQWYLQTVSSISEASASFLGGFLAVISIYLPYYTQFSVYLLFFPLAFFLQEPKQHKHDNKEWIWKGIINIVRYSLHEHKEVKWLILFSWAFWASTLVMSWLLQQYFTHVGVPLVYFGVLWSIFVISLVPFSFFAHNIEEFLGRKNSLLFLAFLPVLWYFFLAFFDALWALFFVFFFYFARGFASVLLNDYVNIIVPSQIRATVLSIQTLMFRFVFVIIGPLVGWISDTYSLQVGLFFAGCIFSLFFIVSLFFLHKNKALSI